MVKPEVLRLWNVRVTIGKNNARRIQVASHHTNHSGTIDREVESYYKGLIKEGTKITVSSKLSKRTTVLIF